MQTRHMSYLALMGLFAGGAAVYGASRRRAVRYSDEVSWSDLALLGIATHQIARIAAQDRVTSPIRAPFTDDSTHHAVETPSDSAASQGSTLGANVRRSVGELVTCKYCLAPWIALGLHATYLHQPSFARALSSVFVTAGISDFVNRAYGRLEESSDAA